MSVIGYCSPGIRRIRYLEALLEAPCKFFIHSPGEEVTQIAGWGLKRTARRARRIAAERGLPYISLEDGFLRSLDLGVAGAPAHSMVVDYSGIYYDATRPSDLESLILVADFPAADIERARHCIELLQRHRLSKYNRAPDTPVEWPDARRRVLVVDQTEGDAAISFGGATAQSFEQMLDSAEREHPQAEICVKVHPDVIAGKKQGHLAELARGRGCLLLADDISPWALLDAVDDVYVVTSQFGFDALLAGKKVHCFGLPFYAGWGLTEDRQECARRGQKRSLEQVFCAAYLRYSRYINPYTGQRCELEDTIRLLVTQKRLRERFGSRWLAAGFSPWKRRFVPNFLGHPDELEFIPLRSQALRERTKGIPVAAWASRLPADFVHSCAEMNLPLWRMEDGFLRSVGLGAHLVNPLSLVLDSSGIYYDARSPSDLEKLLRQTEFSPELLARAHRLRDFLVREQLSKYNVGARNEVPEFPAGDGRKIILVPGQVETDASIACGSPVLKTNLQLLQAVRAANPDAFVIYKPHPDVVDGARAGVLAGDTLQWAGLFDREVTDIALPLLFDAVDEVHTLCSLSGFEALLRGRRVVTYGLPFYAGWGLSDDLLLQPENLAEVLRHADSTEAFDPAPVRERRGRPLSIDELVAGALILYPVYCDPESGEVVDVETAVQILQAQRLGPARLGLIGNVYRLLRKYLMRQS